jgi:Ca2+-binding EF-hand superfamily protein
MIRSQKKKELLRLAKEREKINKQTREEQEEKIGRWFDKFDSDQNRELDAGELTALFMWLDPGDGTGHRNDDGDSAEAISEDNHDEASETVGIFMEKHIPDVKTATKSDLVGIITKYFYYLRQKAYLDKIFSKYDVMPQDGVLDKQELIKLLQFKEKEGKLKRGRVEVEVTEADAEMLIKVCELDKSDGITRAHILEAVIEWELVADARRKTKKSALCVVL